MITNFDTYMNEGIRDLMKPKNDEEIKKGLEKLYPLDRIKSIEKYKLEYLYSEDEMKALYEELNLIFEEKKERVLKGMTEISKNTKTELNVYYDSSKEFSISIKYNDVEYWITIYLLKDIVQVGLLANELEDYEKYLYISDAINQIYDWIDVYEENMNESIKDLMKPKSKKEIEDDVKNMLPDERLSKGMNNKIFWIVEDALKNGAKVTSYHINQATTFDTLEIFNILKKYKDKKINESVEKKYPYNEIVIKVNNIDEVNKYQNFIDDVIRPNRQLYDMSRVCIYTFPNYIFIYVRKYHNKNIFDACYLADGDEEHMNDMFNSEIINKPKVNQHIFTVSDSDLKTVESILKYGIEQRIPSYEPRKITRTLESNLNENFTIANYPYNGIAFKVNDFHEVKRIIDFFYDKLKIEQYNEKEEILYAIKEFYDHEEYRYISVDLTEKGFFRILKKEQLEEYTTFDQTIYTVSDLYKFSPDSPSYSPRKISRTLESASSNDIYNSDYFKKYNSLFIEIKPYYFLSYDAFEYFIRKLENIFYTKFDDLEETYDGIFTEHSYIRFTITDKSADVGYGTFDMLNDVVSYCSLTYKKLYSINEIKSGLDNNLHNILYDAPSYEPRKISRTLEGVRNLMIPKEGAMDKINKIFKILANMLIKDKYFDNYEDAMKFLNRDIIINMVSDMKRYKMTYDEMYVEISQFQVDEYLYDNKLPLRFAFNERHKDDPNIVGSDTYNKEHKLFYYEDEEAKRERAERIKKIRGY